FYDGGKLKSDVDILLKAEQMLKEGAAILDVGGMSSKPNAAMISEEDELYRVIAPIKLMHQKFPEAIISVDTFRSKVAVEAVNAGASIINDISAGRFDENFLPTVAKLKTPYILMHMQGTPQTMQQAPVYEDAVKEVFDFLQHKIFELQQLGIHDIVIDPGFGFGKTVEHNFQLLQHLDVFKTLGLPILAGLSRKSMICKVLKVNPDKALNGTTALNAVALMKGAKILRVHDVKEAKETISLISRCDD
ncbi:MAG: dihydropteroate synthase, partial [Chitinophagales bacterium]|nr:dihydropteroate synthase [Chitinophagales bacterium]